MEIFLFSAINVHQCNIAFSVVRVHVQVYFKSFFIFIYFFSVACTINFKSFLFILFIYFYIYFFAH